MTKEELITYARSLEEKVATGDGGKKRKSPASASAKAAPPSPASNKKAKKGPTPQEIKSFCGKVKTEAVREIKKATHNFSSKPYTSFSIGMEESNSKEIFKSFGFTPVKNKLMLDPDDVEKMFGIDKIENVKSNQKVWMIVGRPPPKFHAVVIQCEVKIEKLQCKFKFRTQLPEHY
uniref:Uncharacterized protein n=1 Tax=Chromera velia CCMP2878 TaxID=1169474 RepID=A0A0G4HDB5_9ALVE|eukprot:Cvel_6378.t1-p1 / transcript=Cvel_6378.t1 / gene=Cvel_6378 / organism=Chromera_velia_CCMP2878 / gene_product=hypothetical protein / transcript_product=hypothetical protein / location=Cvel_scaffold310:90945-91469(+) / protein_length=175 / sequence_SO=supercontig / SO=protein_coding / is_pseudo=false